MNLPLAKYYVLLYYCLEWIFGRVWRKWCIFSCHKKCKSIAKIYIYGTFYTKMGLVDFIL